MALLLAIFYFFYFGIVGIYIIFMPKVLMMVGYSASEIGIIFAAGPLVRFLLPFAFTRGLELNFKNFNISLFIMLVSSLAFYMFLYDFWGLFLANITLSIGMSLILPYVEVIALEVLKKRGVWKNTTLWFHRFCSCSFSTCEVFKFPSNCSLFYDYVCLSNRNHCIYHRKRCPSKSSKKRKTSKRHHISFALQTLGRFVADADEFWRFLQLFHHLRN